MQKDINDYVFIVIVVISVKKKIIKKKERDEDKIYLQELAI